MCILATPTSNATSKNMSSRILLLSLVGLFLFSTSAFASLVTAAPAAKKAEGVVMIQDQIHRYHGALLAKKSKTQDCGWKCKSTPQLLQELKDIDLDLRKYTALNRPYEVSDAGPKVMFVVGGSLVLVGTSMIFIAGVVVFQSTEDLIRLTVTGAVTALVGIAIFVVGIVWDRANKRRLKKSPGYRWKLQDLRDMRAGVKMELDRRQVKYQSALFPKVHGQAVAFAF